MHALREIAAGALNGLLDSVRAFAPLTMPPTLPRKDGEPGRIRPDPLGPARAETTIRLGARSSVCPSPSARKGFLMPFGRVRGSGIKGSTRESSVGCRPEVNDGQ